jgi:hypothetical protein
MDKSAKFFDLKDFQGNFKITLKDFNIINSETSLEKFFYVVHLGDA